MKIVIISDIKGKAESIIPYGLRLAAYLQWEVDIIHSVDTREQKGVNSPYSDSQTLVPGNKLSHEEIIKRDVTNTELLLNKLLSGEGSRLNYPLKYNTIVQVESIENMIGEIDPLESLVMVSTQPDKYIFHSLSEINQVFKHQDLALLFVPPGLNFKPFEKATLVTDFSSDNVFEKFFSSLRFVDQFNPLINAIDVAKPKQYLEKDLKSKSWQKLMHGTIPLISSPIKSNILTGQEYIPTVKGYIDRNVTDLIINFKQDKGFFNKNIHERLLKGLIDDSTNVPIVHQC